LLFVPPIPPLKFVALQSLTIDFHRSVSEEALLEEAIECLNSNRVDPKFLYITPRQAELWRQVFLQHSPFQANTEFTRIYREAFGRALSGFFLEKVFLVGLGCGTGVKELELAASLKNRDQDVLFSAIDVSRDLVEESAQKLADAGATHRRSLVCDLGQTAFLGEWLDHVESEIPRLITFFGLAPNLAPSLLARLFRAILRPGDILLASAHLAPVNNESPDELRSAMETVLPQYDNPATLAWLASALESWELENLLHPPAMHIGQVEGIPAFVASAKWKTNAPFERWDHRFTPSEEEPLLVFYSLRYTPRRFADVLLKEGFSVELLSITSCRQEAIWSVRIP